MFLISVQIVKALGVSQISPVDLKLLGGDNADLKVNKGDTARFYFLIQVVPSEGKQSCSSSITGMDPLIISLDENETIMEAGEIKNVYGTVTVPSNTPTKIYSGKLTVRCTPKIESTSGSLIFQTTGLNVRIEVVEKAKEGTSEVKEIKMIVTPHSLATIISIAIILVVFVSLYVNRRRKKMLFFKPESNVPPTQ